MENREHMTISITGTCEDLTSDFNFNCEHKDVLGFVGASIHPDVVKDGKEQYHIECMIHGAMRPVDFLNVIHSVFNKAIEFFPAKAVADVFVTQIMERFDRAIEKHFKGKREPSNKELMKMLLEGLKGALGE